MKNFGVILKNVIIAYVITIILFMIYALILEFTNVPEATIPISTSIIGAVSVFIASSFSMVNLKEKGLVNGAIVGITYILILYLVSSILGTGFKINITSFWIIIFNVLIGMIGGIIGVNMSREGR